MQYMIDTVEFTTALHRNDILRLGNYTDGTVVTAVTVADGANFPVRQILTVRAVLHRLFRLENGAGKLLRILKRQAQHMEGKPLGGLAADVLFIVGLAL